MYKQMLNMDAMKSDFFEDTAMIGIVSAQPGYRFCWLLNKYFDLDFKNYPEQNLSLNKKDKKQENTFYFPTYQHNMANCSYHYLLYKLKNGTEVLLPEIKHLDYLWLIQTDNAAHDAHVILQELRNMPQAELCQLLSPEQIQKSLDNLIV